MHVMSNGARESGLARALRCKARDKSRLRLIRRLISHTERSDSAAIVEPAASSF
jgi:hypothetical protein